MGPFHDRDIRLELLAAMIWDRHFMRAAGHWLQQDDFRPLSGGAHTLWILAGLSLNFYRRYREPVASMIVHEVETWFRESNASDDAKNRMWRVLRKIKSVYDPSRTEILQAAVVDFKKQMLRGRIIKELIEREAANELTDSVWAELTRKPLDEFSADKGRLVDWKLEASERMDRRLVHTGSSAPAILIDCLDQRIRLIGRGHLGMWLAPWKSGKSTAMAWTAVAYAVQGFNVLLVTLEDQAADVENRLDASVTGLAIEELSREVGPAKKRFRRFETELLSRGNVKIYDAVSCGMAISELDNLWLREKERGFDADVVLVDSDDKITPPYKHQERRFEFGEIYQQFVKFAARRQVIGWVSSQSRRDAEGKRVIGGATAAEDISKVRQVSLAIGIGRGDWGEESRYLYVAAHRYDRQHIGGNIFTDLKCGLFYDRERTIAKLRERL